MENIIIYVVIAISIVVSIIKNFKKEDAANAKRVVGKPTTGQAPSPHPKPIETEPTPTIFAKKEKTVPILVTKPKEKTFESMGSLETTLAGYDKDKFAQSEWEKASVNNVVQKIDSHELLEYDYSQATDEKETSVSSDSNTSEHSFFETKDDFKKAVLYNIILERKYQ